MSRTDKHTPYRIKKLQPEWRAFFTEHHDHRDRPCNFDPKNDNWKTDCLLSDRSQGKNIHCGCRMCTGQDARRQDRRSERQRAKRAIHAGRWDEATYVNRSHLSW